MLFGFLLCGSELSNVNPQDRIEELDKVVGLLEEFKEEAAVGFRMRELFGNGGTLVELGAILDPVGFHDEAAEHGDQIGLVVCFADLLDVPGEVVGILGYELDELGLCDVEI